MATQPLPNKSWEAVEGPVTCNATDMINIHITGTGTGATIDAGLRTPGSAFDATTNPAVGVFIYRSVNGTGTFSITGDES